MNKKEYNKEYYLKHKQHLNEYSKDYRKDNKDIIKISQNRWLKNHPDSNRNWRKENPEKARKIYNRYNCSDKGKNRRKTERQKHIIHINARHKLGYLFRKKYIVDSDFICAICGKQVIEKHHENYDLPYVFIPLCKEHHIMATNNQRVI